MIIKSLSSTQAHQIVQDVYHQEVNHHTSFPDRPAVASVSKTSVLSSSYNIFYHLLLMYPLPVSHQKSVTSNQTKFDTTDDVQIVGATKTNSLALKTILLLMSVKIHEVKGDGNCLYHSIAH